MRLVLYALLVGLVSACVQVGDAYVPPENVLEITPGEEYIWDGDEIGLTDWQIVFPAGALSSAQRFAIEITAEMSSPTTSQGYELAATAIAIYPSDLEFDEPIRLRIPKPIDDTGRTQMLWSFDGDHLRESFWDYASLTTESAYLVAEIYLTGTYWPVRLLRASPLIENPAEQQACIQDDDPGYAAMEEPQREGECKDDSDCFISGCQNEVCADKVVLTECSIRPAVCAACGCAGGTCRWLE